MSDALIKTIAGIIASASPIIFGVVGETLTERVGVINLSINGTILLTAMAGFAVAKVTGSYVLGILAGALIGAFIALIIAFMSITLKQSQVAVGYILAMTGLSLAYFLGNEVANSPVMDPLPKLAIPLLSKIPLLGMILFNQNLMVYLSILAIIITHIWIFKTSYGLVLRGVGERPAAAFIRGTNVNLVRYLYTVIGGALIGMAGPLYSLDLKRGWAGSLSGLDGLGWIILAIVIFGGWRPFRGALGAYFFVFLQVISINMQHQFPHVNTKVFQVAPFPIMILILLFVNIGNAEWVDRTLAGLPADVRKAIAWIFRVLKTNPPGSLGVPFESE